VGGAFGFGVGIDGGSLVGGWVQRVGFVDLAVVDLIVVDIMVADIIVDPTVVVDV
jgi:hypothetical protein